MRSKTKVQAGKKKMWAWLIAGILLFMLVNGFGLFMGNRVYEEIKVRQSEYPVRKSEKLQQQMDFGKRQKQWQDVQLTSRYGYPLAGTFIPSPEPTDNTIIFLHGFSESRLSGLYYLGIYRDAGFNALFIDSRSHGDSGGNSVTWGVYEKYDVSQWVSWLRQSYPDGIIGIHGISMGAATALLHAEMNEQDRQVSFYIADSSYSDLETLLKWGLVQRIPDIAPFVPELVLPYANAAAYLNDRFTFYQASPLRAVRGVTTPILYIHGEADSIIPVSMVHELYSATKGPRQLYIFRQGGHAGGVFEDWARYNEIIRDFISSIQQ